MEFCKLQIGCLAVLLYVALIYSKEYKHHHVNLKGTLFDKMLVLGILSVIFDGATAYTVNHLDTVNPVLNAILHMLFLISLDAVIFLLFIYMLFTTGSYPQKGRLLVYAPFVVNVVLITATIGSIDYVQGEITNYSTGFPAYACFSMAAVYVILTCATFIKRWNYIESHKRTSIITYLLVLTLVTVLQFFMREALITSIGVTVFILGIYLNQEDPALKELSRYHGEMVMSFANLIEDRDNNTGGHIKRTSMYVGLIAEELRKNEKYKDILTKDYITNLLKAAPMHDIGKISVPDAILQKPGKLTDEEFAVMKLHAEKGATIIRESFRNLGNEEYRQMAFEVARYHHEKWNGKGYPVGLKEEEIPLCARIMAVADVFDAVSEKRCYRDAMPLDKCFAIIEEGIGRDFDSDVAQAFLKIRDKVEKVHADFAAEAEQQVQITQA